MKKCKLAIFKELCSLIFFFFSSRRRHTRLQGDWSSDVCSSDLSDSLFGFHAPLDYVMRDAVDRFLTIHGPDEGAFARRTLPPKCPFIASSPYEIGRASCRERV